MKDLRGNAIDFALYLGRNVARNAFQNSLFKQPFYSQSVLQLCAGFALEVFHVQPQIVLLILLFL